VVGSVAATLVLVVLLVGRWDELEVGLTGAPLAVVVAAVSLQVLALVSRSDQVRAGVSACASTYSPFSSSSSLT
jgi:hypothetical protein